jgi:hypothetical protein
MNSVIAVPEHADLTASEDGQLTKKCKIVNIYKLNHTGWCQQLFYNVMNKFTVHFRKVWLGKFPPVATS